MSGDTDAAPRAHWSASIETVVRLLTIAVGTVSAVLLARDGFNIPLNAYVDAIATAYDDAFTSIALVIFDPVIKVAFERLRDWFGIELQLLPHWKHAFVLLWLLLGADARNDISPRAVKALGTIIAGVSALVGGALVGTAPLGDMAIYWLALVGVTLNVLGAALLALVFSGLFRAWGTLFTYLVLYGPAIFTGTAMASQGAISSPGLASLALMIVVAAGVYIIWGLQVYRPRHERSGTFWQLLTNAPLARAGTDILAVVASALVSLSLS
jgi:hypothetical protein